MDRGKTTTNLQVLLLVLLLMECVVVVLVLVVWQEGAVVESGSGVGGRRRRGRMGGSWRWRGKLLPREENGCRRGSQATSARWGKRAHVLVYVRMDSLGLLLCVGMGVEKKEI